MATTNESLTKTWAKLADDADDPVLVTCRGPAFLEVALTATDTAPTVRGHHVAPGQAITRSAVGDGFLWMRCDPAGSQASAFVEVTK
jgi:hypothetical protein